MMARLATMTPSDIEELRDRVLESAIDIFEEMESRLNGDDDENNTSENWRTDSLTLSATTALAAELGRELAQRKRDHRDLQRVKSIGASFVPEYRDLRDPLQRGLDSIEAEERMNKIKLAAKEREQEV